MRQNTISALLFCAVTLLMSAPGSPARAQVQLQTRGLRLEIAADAKVKSLRALPIAAELAANPDEPVAAIYRGGDMAVGAQENYAEHTLPEYRGGECIPATSAALEGDRLTLGFAPAGVTATYRVIAKPDYLAFELLSLTGAPIDRIDLLRLRVKRPANLGAWIDAAWDDRFGVCLCGGNIDTAAGMTRHPADVEMRAVGTRDVKLEGTVAVLFGCANPREKFLDSMEIVERDFNMPPGARNRRAPVLNQSYFWASPTPADIDQYIEVAKRAGFRTFLYSYTAFTNGAGHFVFNKNYPRGMADLKYVADRIRAAGLGVGLHIHYSKTDRADSYVTPVPDDRLHQVRAFTLAGDIDSQATTIRVREDPSGTERADGRRILKIGKELVSYTAFTTGSLFTFTGCERGHLKTTAAAHMSGEKAGLLDVDDWIKFIRYDQATDIQDEAARRIAEIYNATGPYELVYFDGAEDVHHPFWRNVVGAQWRVYRLFNTPPPVCEAAMNSHYGWHMMTRGNAFDVVGAHIKPFIHEISCREAGYMAGDFTTIDFGWIYKLNPDAGPDIFEYILSRGAAYRCPFSLRLAAITEVAANPRAQDCFDAIKTWEDARIGGKITAAMRAELATLDPAEHQHVKTWYAVYDPKWIATWKVKPFQDREHHLFVNERGDYELVEVHEVKTIAGLKAYLFQRAGEPGDTYATLWAVKDDVRLALPVAPDKLKAMRPFGKTVSLEQAGGQCAMTVGNRIYLRFTGMNPAQAAEILGARP